MKLSMRAAVLLPCLFAAGLSVHFARAQHGPETAVLGTKQFRQTELVSGLAGPWEWWNGYRGK